MFVNMCVQVFVILRLFVNKYDRYKTFYNRKLQQILLIDH